MSDNGDEEGEADEEEPAVELGEGEPVEGAPVARVASRLAIAEFDGRLVLGRLVAVIAHTQLFPACRPNPYEARLAGD